MGLFDTTFPLWQPSPTGDRPLYAQDDGMMPFNLLRALYAPTRSDDNSAFKDALASAGQGPTSFFSGPQAPPPAPGGLPAWASLPAGSNVGLPDTSAARVAARGSEFGDLPLPKQFQPPAPKSDEAFNAPGFKFGPPPAATFPTFGAGAAPVGLAGGGVPGLAPPPPPPSGPAMAAPAVPAGFQGQQPMVPPQPGAPAAPLPPDVQVAGPPGASTGTPAAAAPSVRAAQLYGNAIPPGPPPPDSVYQALGQQPAGGTGGGLGGAFRGMAANMSLGPLGMIGGLLGGAMGMGEGTDRQQQLAQMQATFQAARGELMNQGYDKNEASRRAMLIATNPQAAQAGMPELVGNRLEKTVLKDEIGGEHVQYYDRFTGQRVNAAGEPMEGGAGAGMGSDFSANMQTLVDMKAKGATPQQLLAAVNPKWQSYVKAMITGRALPQWLGSRSQLRGGLLEMSKIIDENMDDAELAARPQSFQKWKNGADAGIVRRVDQLASHFGDLVNDQMPALPGHAFVPANRIANAFNSEVLGKAAANNFQINGNALANELAGIWKDNNMSDHAIQEWAKGLSPNMSIEQQRGAAKTILKLYGDGVDSIERKRETAVGKIAAEELGPVISPKGQAQLEAVRAFAYGGEPSAASGTLASGVKKGWTVTEGVKQ